MYPTSCIQTIEINPFFGHKVGASVSVDISKIIRRSRFGSRNTARGGQHDNGQLKSEINTVVCFQQEIGYPVQQHRIPESELCFRNSHLRTVVHPRALLVDLVSQSVTIKVYEGKQSIALRAVITKVSATTGVCGRDIRSVSNGCGTAHTPAFPFCGSQCRTVE